MKTKNILVSVCGLAALFCSCTKNEPEKGPEKTPVAVEEVKLDATARVQRGAMPVDRNCASGGCDIRCRRMEIG